MDRIEAMTVFVAAADERSLAGAGRRLQMTRSSVSRKLAELEAHLGVRLMTRSTRQLALTDAGRDYLSAAREILDRLAEAERSALAGQACPRGELVVAAPLVFGRFHVLPIVADLLGQFGSLSVRLVLSDANANLLEENIDVAVRIGPLADSGLTARKVGEIASVVCASPDYLAAQGTPASPGDLQSHSCVTFEGFPSAAWPFAGPEGPTRVPIRSRLTVNTADAVVAAAVGGVGIARVLSYQVAQQFAEGKLVRLLEAYEPAPSPVSLLYARQGALPAKTSRFLELAGERLAKVLSRGE